MKKNFLLIVFFFILLLPAISFSSTRKEVIDKELSGIELALSSQDSQNNKDIDKDPQDSQYLSSDYEPVLQAQEDRLKLFRPEDKNKRSTGRANAIKDAFYIAAGYDINRIHYSEWAGGVKLDEDYGKHDGLYYTVGYRSPNHFGSSEYNINRPFWVIDKLFIEGYYREFSNIIHYKGAFIGGKPYNGDDRSEVKELGVKWGGYNDFSDKGEFYGYVDIGKRVWNRGEDVSPSYHEKYYWLYSGYGVGVNYRLLQKLSTGFESEFLSAFKPKMHANLGSMTFELGNVWGVTLKLPIKFYILKNLSVDLIPYYTYWSIGASNVVDGYYEPDSKTHIEGILSGLTCFF